MESSAALRPTPAARFQFTIRSLLWLMITLAMILAFVRPANGHLLPVALGAGLSGIALGTFIGWKPARIAEAIYWSLLSMSLAVVCLAGQPYVTTAQILGWPLVGVIAGAIAGATPPGRLRLKLVACVAAGTAPMVGFACINPNPECWGDVVLAAAVSGLLAMLSDLFAWARTRYHTSYGAWAASLVLAVILGNWGASWLTPRLANWLGG